MSKTLLVTFTLHLALLVARATGEPQPPVRTMRVPDNGIQPQVVAQGDTVHLIYFTGDPKAGDVNYARSTDGGRTFGKAIRVNSEPASAIAIGTIRGPRMAVGRNGRVHVAWMGSDRATPRGPDHGVPMLYTRLNDAGDAFEAQRNVIAEHSGLDGDGTVAADDGGHVYVVWHAPEKQGDADEQARAVWVVQSKDEGRTFGTEARAGAVGKGVCACCGLEAHRTDAQLYVLYRSAFERVHRDMWLSAVGPQLERGASEVVGRLEIGTCVMSTADIAETPRGPVAAWEGRGEVFYVPLEGIHLRRPPPLSPPGQGKNRKHPRLAAHASGPILLVWTEDTAWNRGGSVAWQLLDDHLKPVGPIGRAPGLPVWGTAAAFPTPDGGFAVIY